MLAVLASLAVHAGLGAWLLIYGSSLPSVMGAKMDGAMRGDVAVSLIRSVPRNPTAIVDAIPQRAEPSGPAISFEARHERQAAAQVTALGKPAPPRAVQANWPGEEDIGRVAPAIAAIAVDPEAGSDYQRRLLAHIEAFRHYPEQADGDRLRGVVHLLFEIDRAGSVSGIRLADTSGSAILDAAAIDTVRRAAPLPPIPPGLPEAMTVQLPVEFSASG